MKSTTGASAALASLLVAVAFVNTAAQALQNGDGNATSQPDLFPVPTNLKVLPKDLTGQQVHELMEQWGTGLGLSCAACHAEDKEKVGQDDRPILNFAGDSKPEKAAARLMYTMTEEINRR